MTLSGGEPLVQASFATALLERCRGAGIHTVVETCGHGAREALLGMEPLVDRFYFDLKLADEAEHERATGVSNQVIVGNLRALAERARERIVVRVPVVPGVTDAEANANGIAALVEEAGVGEVELRPYHGMGAHKYEELGRAYGLGELPAFLGEEALRRFAEPFVARGMRCW